MIMFNQKILSSNWNIYQELQIIIISINNKIKYKFNIEKILSQIIMFITFNINFVVNDQ